MNMPVAVLDFDGVILESVDIKTEAFQELFSAYGDKLPTIMDYHLANNGISRMIKIRHIFENILNTPFTPKVEADTRQRFSEVVMSKILKCRFVPGAPEFLEKFSGRVKFYVASAAPEDELKTIIERRGLQKYFTKIFGHPTHKREAVKWVLLSHPRAAKELVFIGDANEDRKVALEHGVTFLGRKNKEIFPEGTVCYDDLFGVTDWFENHLFSGKTSFQKK